VKRLELPDGLGERLVVALHGAHRLVARRHFLTQLAVGVADRRQALLQIRLCGAQGFFGAKQRRHIARDGDFAHQLALLIEQRTRLDADADALAALLAAVRDARGGGSRAHPLQEFLKLRIREVGRVQIAQ